MKEYDVFIIGSGMAGMTTANKCASKGLKVGITDELPFGRSYGCFKYNKRQF
tara:strand:- start:1387 stop:1542 length:156 start_codon:yes stop_codon:yes gene_type:complete